LVQEHALILNVVFPHYNTNTALLPQLVTMKSIKYAQKKCKKHLAQYKD